MRLCLVCIDQRHEGQVIAASADHWSIVSVRAGVIRHQGPGDHHPPAWSPGQGLETASLSTLENFYKEIILSRATFASLL